MTTVVPLILVLGLVLALAAICFRLVTSGRVRMAWAVPGGVALLALVFAAVVSVLDTYGQAGLAAVFVLMLLFLPLLAGGVLGCLAGHLARGFGTGHRDAEKP